MVAPGMGPVPSYPLCLVNWRIFPPPEMTVVPPMASRNSSTSLLKELRLRSWIRTRAKPSVEPRPIVIVIRISGRVMMTIRTR
jgi:hypothetical protein